MRPLSPRCSKPSRPHPPQLFPPGRSSSARPRLFRSRCSPPGPFSPPLFLSRCPTPPGLSSRGCSGSEARPATERLLRSSSVSLPPPHGRASAPEAVPQRTPPACSCSSPGTLRPAAAARPGPRAARARREGAQSGTAASLGPAAAHPPGPRRSSAPSWSRHRHGTRSRTTRALWEPL